MYRPSAAVLMLLAVTFALPAAAQDVKTPPRSISLTGHGEVRLAPDMAVVSIGVMSQAETARDALSANNAAMAQIIATLKAAGVAEKDTQTSNFMVQPRYDYNNNTQPPQLVGYDVSNTVTVTVRALERLGAVLDQVVSAGSNQINGILFDIAKPEAALDAARTLAAADATRKAKTYAEALSLQLGDVLSITESGGVLPPQPMYRTAMAAEAQASSVPVAAGEQELSVDVNITWEIK